MITFLGRKKLSDYLPFLGTFTGFLALSVDGVRLAVAASLPNLQARLAGFIGLQAKLAVTPPSIGLALAAAIKTAASLTAALTLSPPVVSGALQLQAVATAVLELQALIVALELQLDALGPIVDALAELEVQADASLTGYTYSGPLSSFGPELAASIDAGQTGGLPYDQPVKAFVVVADGPDVKATAALSFFFGVD